VNGPASSRPRNTARPAEKGWQKTDVTMATALKSKGYATGQFGKNDRDVEREWAYDRTSPVGKLDKAWDEAAARGWSIVSMKDDWKDVFPPAK
jgi:arylsulfatase A-like enzyme